MINQIFFMLLKYFLYLLCAFVIWLLYLYVVKPICWRWHYSKYKNVWVSPRFVFFFGDSWDNIKNIMNGKVFYDHHRHIAKEVCKCDFKLEMVGTNPFIKVISYEAQAGLEALATARIDRGREWIGIGKVIGHSFGMSRSTYKAMYRRKVILNMLSLNAASKYIPLMYDCLKHEIGEWEVGKTLDSVYEMNVLTFGFFTVVFFGQDTLQISKSTIPFEEDDGRIVDKTMMDFLIATLKNIFQGLIHPIASLAPFLAENDLCNPYRRNKRNLLEFQASLRKLIDESKDEDSICNKLIQDPKIKYEELFIDVLGFLAAGTETTSHTLVVILYQLKKNPKCLKKCMEELERHGFTDLDNKEIYNPESIEKLTYITYVVKESLRIDCPTYQSLEYAAYEDVEIAGVPFKKGTTFFKDSSIIHYDPEEFFEPLKFIPERFDPEHKYFFRPSDGKARRPYSNVPFSYGSRACPGQTFAMLELKVTLAYILTHAEYSIPEDILKSETIGFAIGSTFECPLKISKVNK